MSKTGIGELDDLMSLEDERMMVIDVGVFDATILQFFINDNKEYSKEARYAELKNIWTNYYHDSFKDNFNPANIFGTPFKIVDVDNNVVAITPPLMDNLIVPNINAVATSYIEEARHNPMESRVRFLKDGKKMFSVISGNEWIKFIAEYLEKRNIKITDGNYTTSTVDDWLKED